MTHFPRLFFLAAAVVATMGCAPSATDEMRDLSVVRVALTQVPTGVRCVRFSIATGGATILRPFTVTAGTMPTLTMGGLPNGPANVLAEAFDVACTSIVAATLPTWVASPLMTMLNAGELTNLSFVLRPAAGANATLDFLSIALTPSAHDFGTVVLGQPSMPVTFTVRNVGPTATGALTTTITGVDGARFAIAMNGCTTLAIGGSCTVIMTFSPTVAGARSAALQVSGSPGGTVGAMLAGVGVAASRLVVTPAASDYGTATIGVGTPARIVTVTNNGGVASGPLQLTLTGMGAGDFQMVMPTCMPGAVLPPMGSCTVPLRFFPTSAGMKSAALTVQASPGGTTMTSLVGFGVTPAMLVLTPASLDFGSVGLGSVSPDRVFLVTNTGGSATGGPLSIGISGTGEFQQGSNTCAMPLPAMASCQINLRFAPAVPGPRAATLNVGGPGLSPVTAMLVGTGAQSGMGLRISPITATFPATAVGATSAMPTTFVVTNTGGPTATVLTTSLGGLNPMDFFVVMDLCAGRTLGPGMSCQIVLNFGPTAVGTRNATLTIGGPLPGAPIVVAAVSGPGL